MSPATMVMRELASGEARASDAECASGATSPKAASRVTRRGVAVKLEQRHGGRHRGHEGRHGWR